MHVALWHHTIKHLANGFQVLCVLSQAFFVVAIIFGLGAHVEDLGHSDVVVALHTTWVSQISGIVAAVTGKLSIIAFLNQIRGRHRGRPWFLYFIGASNIVVNIIVVVFILIQCTPLVKLWDERVPGDCKARPLNENYAYFQGSMFAALFSLSTFLLLILLTGVVSLGYSALSDAALALYPIHLISRLQVSVRMKIGLSFLLGFGLLATVCTVAKTVQLTNLIHADEDLDITFFIARLALTTIVEAWIVMIVGCIPPLRPLMKAFMNRVRGISTTNQTPNTYEYGKHGMPSVRSATISRATRPASTGKQLAAYDDSKLSMTELSELQKSTRRNSSESEKMWFANSNSGGGIVVRTDVDVSYEGREQGTTDHKATQDLDKWMTGSGAV